MKQLEPVHTVARRRAKSCKTATVVVVVADVVVVDVVAADAVFVSTFY